MKLSTIVACLFVSLIALAEVPKAHASTICNVGSIATAPSNGTWGSPSTCSCSGLSGTAYANVSWFAVIATSGSGEVWMQLEWAPIGGGGGAFYWTEASAGGYFFATAPNGREGQMANNFPDYYWTGRYRAICAQ